MIYKIEKMLRKLGEKRQRLRAVQSLASLQDSILSDALDGGGANKVLDDMVDVYIYLEMLKIIYDITDAEFKLLTRYKVDKTLNELNRR